MACLNRYHNSVLAHINDVNRGYEGKIGLALNKPRVGHYDSEGNLAVTVNYYTPKNYFNEVEKPAVVAKLVILVKEKLGFKKKFKIEDIERIHTFFKQSEGDIWLHAWFEPWTLSAKDAKKYHQSLVSNQLATVQISMPYKQTMPSSLVPSSNNMTVALCSICHGVLCGRRLFCQSTVQSSSNSIKMAAQIAAQYPIQIPKGPDRDEKKRISMALIALFIPIAVWVWNMKINRGNI